MIPMGVDLNAKINKINKNIMELINYWASC
jgi:hypothetical protein